MGGLEYNPRLPQPDDIIVLGNSGATFTIDWQDGRTQHLTLSADCTLTFSTPTSGGRYTLLLEQDVTGTRLVTWPSDVRFGTDGEPTLTTNAGQTDYMGFVFNSTDSKYDNVGFNLNF